MTLLHGEAEHETNREKDTFFSDEGQDSKGRQITGQGVI